MSTSDTFSTFGPGKVILLGEHGVVYGHPAIAGALPWGIRATATPAKRCTLQTPPTLPARSKALLRAAFERAVEATGRPPIHVTLESTLPVSMGLGSSAALSVALARLFLHAKASTRLVADKSVLSLALQMEQAFHGTPSGVDHTCSTLGGLIRYQRRPDAAQGRATRLAPGKPLHVLIAIAGERSPTRQTVAALRARQAEWPSRYGRLFSEIGRLVVEGARAIEAGDLRSLGDAMNVNHGLLAALGLSSPALDALVHRLRAEGALGAKFTGAGGDGGAVVALFEDPRRVQKKLADEGIDCLVAELGGADVSAVAAPAPIARRRVRR